MTGTDGAEGEAKSRRKGRLSRPARLALGAFGLFLGTLIGFLALLPSLLSRWGPDWIEERFARERAGRLEVGALRARWFEAQDIEGIALFDPEGGCVARAEARIGPLSELLLGLGRRLEGIEVSLSAELEADEAGATNLQRALAPRDPRSDEGRREVPSSEGGWLSGLQAEARVEAERITWSDAHTRALGPPIELRNLDVRLRLLPGRPLTLTARAELASDEPGRLEVDLEVHRPFGSADPSSPTQARLDARASRLPSGLVDALLSADGRLVAGLGPFFDLTATGAATDGSGELKLELASDTARLELDGVIENGELRLRDAEGPELSLPLTTELARALLGRELPAGLEPLAGQRAELSVEELVVPLGSGDGDGAAGLVPRLEDLRLVASLRAGDWIAAPPGEPPPPSIELRGLEAGLRIEPGAPARATLSCEAGSGAEWTRVESRTSLPWPLRGDLDGLESQLQLERPAPTIARLTGLDAAQALDVLGERLGATLRAADAAEGGGSAWEVDVRGDALSALLRVSEEAGGWTVEGLGEAAVVATVGMPEGVLDPWLPEGATLTREGTAPLSLTRLRLRLPPPDPESGALERFLDGGELDLELLPELWSWSGPAEGADPTAASERFTVQPSLRLRPGGPLEVRLAAPAPRPIDLAIDVRGLRALLADSGPEGTPAPGLEIEIRGSAGGLPTRLIDELAGQDGLLLDALGSAFDLEVDGRWPATAGEPATLNLRSELAGIELRGGFEDGLLTARGEQGLDVRLGLGPLFSRRVVGSLLPLLVGLEQTPGAEPVRLEVRDFDLPLDGDLTRLRGQLNLSLGEVSYEILPELGLNLRQLAGAHAGRWVANIEPIGLSIEGGRVSYQGLAFDIGGQRVPIEGSLGLGDGGLSLTCKLPVGVLSRDLDAKLGQVRQLLGGEVMVPIEIGGTIRKPRLKIEKGFLEGMLEDALKRQLQRGLLDLLGGG